jgi:hypothetical protein
MLNSLTVFEWAALALPLLIVLPVVLINPFGGWKYYGPLLLALFAVAIGGALLLDITNGTKAIGTVVYWWFGRVTLLFAAVSVVSGLYLNTALTLTPRNLAGLVLLGFALGLVIDPLLVLVLVLYPILRGKGPITAAVAVAVATTVSGVFAWSETSVLGSYVQAAMLPASRFGDLWTTGQIYTAGLIILFWLLVLTYLWAKIEWIEAPETSQKVKLVFKSVGRKNWLIFTTLFGGLVVVQYVLPDVHDSSLKALMLKLQGGSVRANLTEILPIREFAYIAIGMVARLFCRPAQKQNKFSYKPIQQAAWVMLLMYASAAPLMTVVFLHQREWPTLVRLAYEFFQWLRAEMPEVWMVQAIALVIAFALSVFPSFVMITLSAHHGGLTWAKLVGSDREKRRLTPLRYVWWAVRLAGFPLLVASVIVTLGNPLIEAVAPVIQQAVETVTGYVQATIRLIADAVAWVKSWTH